MEAVSLNGNRVPVELPGPAVRAIMDRSDPARVIRRGQRHVHGGDEPAGRAPDPGQGYGRDRRDAVRAEVRSPGDPRGSPAHALRPLRRGNDLPFRGVPGVNNGQAAEETAP